MNLVTLTLELSYTKAIEVLELINVTPLGDHTEPVRAQIVEQDKVVTPTIEEPSEPPTEAVVTPGKTTKMPGFGRSKQQVDTYVTQRANRKEELDEEAEARAQRKIDKELKQADKDAETKRKDDEVTAIQEEVNETPSLTPMPKKPWEL